MNIAWEKWRALGPETQARFVRLYGTAFEAARILFGGL